MIILILVLLAGAIIGRILLQGRKLRISKLLMFTVALLIGVLGYNIGSNPEITTALPRLGLISVILGITGMIGSIIATYFVDKFLNR